jgi:anti-anti-sigma regulatory factor
MLRITVNEDLALVTLKLEGKLKGAWVKELERTWHTLYVRPGVKPIQADLSAVSFVDDRGKGLLVLMRRRGVALSATGPLMNSLIEDVEQSANVGVRTLAAAAAAMR